MEASQLSDFAVIGYITAISLKVCWDLTIGNVIELVRGLTKSNFEFTYSAKYDERKKGRKSWTRSIRFGGRQRR